MTEARQIDPIAEAIIALENLESAGVARDDIGDPVSSDQVVEVLRNGFRVVGWGILALLSQGQQVNVNPGIPDRLEDAAKGAFSERS